MIRDVYRTLPKVRNNVFFKAGFQQRSKIPLVHILNRFDCAIMKTTTIKSNDFPTRTQVFLEIVTLII